MQVHIVQGDITTFEGDAIINAAKVTLAGGGGVDGAIHKAAGPGLKEACEAFPALMTMPDGTPIRCEVGQAKSTSGFDLKAKHVIHTVGPIFSEGLHHPGDYQQGDEPHLLLARSIRRSLMEAKKLNAFSVAIPAISCGIFGGDMGDFAYSLNAILKSENLQPLQSVTVYLFDNAQYREFMWHWNIVTDDRPLWKKLLGIGRK